MPVALPFVYQGTHIQWDHQSGPEPELADKVIDEFWVDLSRPLSRGSVRRCSGDPDAAPLTVFDTYARREDLDDMVRTVPRDPTKAAQDPDMVDAVAATLGTAGDQGVPAGAGAVHPGQLPATRRPVSSNPA
ncbi:MAG: hypothetical protein JNM77_03120, partial [Pseudonocardia sp.]|nr:hypothetical protein [Pseudonocardia sp.]